MLLARGVVAIAGLLCLPVVYSNLGESDFGVWVLLSGLVTIVALADLGMGSAIVREVALTRNESISVRRQTALAMGLTWGVSLALLAIVVTAVAWPHLAELLNFGATTEAAKWAMLILLVGAVIDAIAMPARGVLEGIQRYTALAWVTGSTAVLAAALSVAAVTLGHGLVGLAVAATAVAAIRGCAICVIAIRSTIPISGSLAGLNRRDTRALTGYGLRVQVTSASGAVNLELDRFILSGFFGPAVAGGFDLGGRLANLLRLGPAFALVAMFPMAVTRTAERGPGWLDRFNLQATKYLAAFATLGAAILVVCADPLIRAWLGEPNWWAAANIVILAPAYAVNIAAGATAIVTRVEGRPGRETGYAVLAVVLNLALTWPLLIALGPTGVPLATAIGVVASTVYFLVSYHRMTGRPVTPMWRVIWPTLLAATIGAGVGALVAPLLPDGPGRLDALIAALCRGSVVAIVTVIVLAAIGFFSPDDRARVLALAQRHRRLSRPTTRSTG